MADKEEQQDQTAPAEQSATSAEGGTSPEGLESLRRELEETQAKSQEYLDLLQRVQADFVNYRRRMEQEQDQRAARAREQVILKLLPVLDDFDLAVIAVPEQFRDAPWVDGIGLIGRKLRTALESLGVTRIAALGEEFSPYEHEAVLYGPSDDTEAGRVSVVLREGYKLGERVIRPAQVKVVQ